MPKKESTTEKILGRRVYFPIWKDIVGFLFFSAIVVALLVLGYIYDFEPLFKLLTLLFELLFLIIFWAELIPHVINNHQGPIAITTDGEFLIIYQEEVKLYIDPEAIYDMDYKNKKSYIVTPYYYSEKVYNYGRVRLYFLDDDKKRKLVLKNILTPDRVFENVVSFLGWDIILSEDTEIDDE